MYLFIVLSLFSFGAGSGEVLFKRALVVLMGKSNLHETE